MAVKASTSFRTLETEGLHELLSEEEITRLRNTFLSNTFKHLSSEQFREALYKDAKISIDNNTFELLFKRINTKNDGYVTWDEFLSHLILGLKINEVKTKAHDLQIPISKKPRIFKSNHPSLVNYITFNPIVKHDRTYNYNEGNYITCSKDGTLNFWSLNMELKKKVEAKSTNLQATGTSILCIACLSDVSVLVTASTECDLRFYDTLARKFELRVQITTLPHPICSMNYVFHKNIKEKSQLIIGDTGGFLQVMSFSSELRGPFRSKPGLPLLKLSFRNLRKNHDFEIIKFPKVHEGWVQGVQYYQEIESIISCSTTSPGLIVWDTTKLEPLFLYNPHQGVWCFATADKIPLIASGGSDSLVRVWNPHVNSKPLMVFRGHRKAVTTLMFESTGQILASLSEDRCVRVWDVGVQTCLQIYTELEVPIGSLLNSRCSVFYNPATSQIVIGATKITVLELRTNILRDKNSDGVTHASPITVLLYNPLFKVIITCGLDSHILVWDPVTGKRLKFIKHGHMRVLYGERVPVDITSGAFNPGYHLLITGAFDGNLKIWDFNTGSCLRNMETGHGCEITAIIWSDGRIITTSWNRKITEFSDIDDPLNPEGNFRKDWKSDHSDDILSMVARYPDTLVTGTYNGEIIFWNLVAGSTFAKYNVVTVWF